jgi:hypothetical protein
MKKTGRAQVKAGREKSLLATTPWSCTNFGQNSEIDAYVEETGTWETVAETHSVGGAIDAEDVASFIVEKINLNQEMHSVLNQALASLTACLASESIEQNIKRPAEKAIKDIRKIMAAG